MRNAFAILLALWMSIPSQISAQSRFFIGPNVGGNVSRLYSADSFPSVYSRRNKLGYVLGVQMAYDLKHFVSISVGVNYTNKGYKVYNEDTGAVSRNPFISRKFNTINIPVGIIFRQKFSPTSAVHEKFGFNGNFYMNTTAKTVKNVSSNEQFRIKDLPFKSFSPMFYLGAGISGNTGRGDRYEFSVIYNQSLSTERSATLEYGQGFLQKFPLVYRGGFLQFGFSYYFNMGNFKKSDEYFID